MMKKIRVNSNWILFVSVIFITGCLYLFSASTRLTWANYGNDGGDFLAAILTKGIPHPTGYPSYMLLGILFQQIPISDPYFRAVLVSLVPAALSAGFLAIGLKRYLSDTKDFPALLAAGIGALAFGLSPFIWSQAVIVEVHGLQALFVVICIWWVGSLIHYESGKTKDWTLLFLALFFGIGLGNHITLVLILPALLVGLWIATRNGLPKRLIIIQLVFLLCGLSVYLYLPLRAAQYPPINWGNPADLKGFLWVISGKPYQNLLFDLTISQYSSRFFAWANLLKDQFGISGIILAVIGAVQFPFRKKLFNLFLFFTFSIFTIFSIAYGTDDSINYLLPVFLVFSIWIAFAIPVIYNWQYKTIPLGKILSIAAILFIFVKIPFTFIEVDPSFKTQPADYAELFLNEVPKDALVLTSADKDSFPLWYYHFGLNWRKDIKIVVLPLTQFRWYQETLIETYPQLDFPELIRTESNQSQKWGEQVAVLNPGLPLCRTKIINGENSKITIQCSNDLMIEFPFTGSN